MGKKKSVKQSKRRAKQSKLSKRRSKARQKTSKKDIALGVLAGNAASAAMLAAAGSTAYRMLPREA